MIKVIDTEKDNLEALEIKDIIIKDFRKLKAYQLGLNLYEGCNELIKTFPEREKFILADQLNRSSQSVIAQIAEGNSQLYVKKEIQFLSISIGSLCETQSHLDIALVSGYISKEKYKQLDNIAVEIKKLLVTYIRALLEK